MLRKIPFLTHVNYIKGENCSLSHFLESMELALSKEMENRATLDLKLSPRFVFCPPFLQIEPKISLKSTNCALLG